MTFRLSQSLTVVCIDLAVLTAMSKARALAWRTAKEIADRQEFGGLDRGR